MLIEHKQFKSLALPIIIATALLLAIGGCSSDDTTAASLPFTDGDGNAELTGVPVLPASLSTSDTAIDVGYPVDSDTVKVDVYLHPVGDNNNPIASANDQSVTPSTTATITMQFVRPLTAGTAYYTELIACASAAAQCQAGITTSANDTGYLDSGAGTYGKFDMSQSNEVSTGVTIPTITAN